MNVELILLYVGYTAVALCCGFAAINLTNYFFGHAPNSNEQPGITEAFEKPPKLFTCDSCQQAATEVIQIDKIASCVAEYMDAAIKAKPPTIIVYICYACFNRRLKEIEND